MSDTDQIKTDVVVQASAIDIYRLLVIARALDIYAQTGLQVNTAYTPTAMLRNASAETGKKYKRGQFREAATDLRYRAGRMEAEYLAANK